MRELSPTLEAIQKTAPLAHPRVKIEIKNKRGSVVHLKWERLYEDGEDDFYHDVAMPGDGSLIRIRVGLNAHLYRQRVTNPDENSDYSQWTDMGSIEQSCKPAICASGSNVLIFWCHTDERTIKYIESADNGASWGETQDLVTLANLPAHLTASMKDNGDICLVYWENSAIHARKRVSDVWGGPWNQTDNPDTCTSLAVVYHDDWNVIITGKDVSDNAYVWQCVFGDGNQATLNTWTDLDPIMEMASDSHYIYYAAFIDYLDCFRAFWCEYYNLPMTIYQSYWTHSIPNKDFIDNLWREPIPFNLLSNFGIAICHSSTHAWLTTPYGVWRASREITTWNITDAVVEIRQWFNPGGYRSFLKVILDNTAGTYDDFDKLGYEMILSLGYLTSEGNEYSATPSFWITGWKFASPPWFPLRAFYPYGVIGTLEIEAEANWDILRRWIARRPFSWTVDTKTVKQMLEFVLSRAGFELDVFSESTAITTFKPAWYITEGYNGKWAVKKLLSWVEDVLVQRDSKLYLKHPESDDAVDYIYDSMYGVAHLVYRGHYGIHQWDPNRAQVWGTNIMVERFEWDQIEAVDDKLSRIEKPTYPDTTRAAERADRELRHGEIWTGAGGWCQVPTNCGQEVFDVIQITDYTAGVITIKRRVIGILTQYKTRYGAYMQRLTLGLP